MNTDHTNEKDLGTQGTADRAKGKLNEVAGKVQKNVGKMTGDTATEAKGKSREVSGKVQGTVGKGEQKVDQALTGNDTK